MRPFRCTVGRDPPLARCWREGLERNPPPVTVPIACSVCSEDHCALSCITYLCAWARILIRYAYWRDVHSLEKFGACCGCGRGKTRHAVGNVVAAYGICQDMRRRNPRQHLRQVPRRNPRQHLRQVPRRGPTATPAANPAAVPQQIQRYRGMYRWEQVLAGHPKAPVEG